MWGQNDLHKNPHPQKSASKILSRNEIQQKFFSCFPLIIKNIHKIDMGLKISAEHEEIFWLHIKFCWWIIKSTEIKLKLFIMLAESSLKSDYSHYQYFYDENLCYNS